MAKAWKGLDPFQLQLPEEGHQTTRDLSSWPTTGEMVPFCMILDNLAIKNLISWVGSGKSLN